MSLKLRLALRDWDFLTPILLGDVKSERVDLEIDRVGTLLQPHVGIDESFDIAETSFSLFTQARLRGDTSVVGIPHFIMRAFRHRCIITREDSPLTALDHLAGKRIGVTGWQDSGNTWTRAAVKRHGVNVNDAFWYAGRLTEAHPITDRLAAFAKPGRIEACPGERPMMDLLADGWLDAVFTPFMPAGYFDGKSRFRQLLPDARAAEVQYFRDVGYVPGIHLLTIKADLVRQFPWLTDEVSSLLDESAKVWKAKREKYADTSPWLLDELLKVSRDLPDGWDGNGFNANEIMISDFVRELHEQGITPTQISAAELFPETTNI